MVSKKQVLEQLEKTDNLINIYSSIDMVRVEQLVKSKRKLEKVLLNIMSFENDLYLAKIKDAKLNKVS